MHCPLGCSPCIFQTEGYRLVAEDVFGCAKSYDILILLSYLNLIIACHAIHNGQTLISRCEINHEHRPRQRKIIFGAVITKILEIHTNVELATFSLPGQCWLSILGILPYE